MTNKKTFVLHDESVNTRGFRMLTSGANLEEFIKNPVMLLNHSDYSLPIGRWENIRIEGGKILADAVFDENDERGKEVKDKVENGFIRAASIGAWPPEEVSDAYNLQLPGQTGATVTKWTVREASICAIGANHNALAFYDRNNDNKLIDLDAPGAVIKLMDGSNNLNNNEMGKLTELLELSDSASQDAIYAKVKIVLDDNNRLKGENKTLTTAVDGYRAKEEQARKTEAVNLVDAAIKDGRMEASGKDDMIKLFDNDFESAKGVLSSMKPRASVADAIATSQASGKVALGDVASMSWDELDKANKLTQLKDESPDIYKEKFKARFGVTPEV